MPKLAEAWVDITTKDAGFYKGMGSARKEVEATAGSFTRGTSIMVRSAERPYRAMRRIFNILKEVTRQTEDGKFAVEDADKAWGGLVNQMVAMATGGMDTAEVFKLIGAFMRSLTKDTDDYALAMAGVTRQILAFRVWVSDHAQLFGMSGLALKLSDSDVRAFKEQIDDLDKTIRDKNNDLTKRDVKQAQDRANAVKKESDQKKAEFLSIEDVWRDAQKRMTEREAGKFNRPPDNADQKKQGPHWNNLMLNLPAGQWDTPAGTAGQTTDSVQLKEMIKQGEEQNGTLKQLLIEAKKKSTSRFGR